MTDAPVLGFIGLGVMGEAMCRNLAQKSGLRIVGFDIRAEPLARLGDDGVEVAPSASAVVEAADRIFMSLPGGPELEAIVAGPQGILAQGRAGQIVVDHTTAPVALTRHLADRLAAAEIGFLDAPVARTRAAAVDGTLAIMVGGPSALLAAVRPQLDCMGTAITHCGSVGTGQTVKLMNNMVLVQSVVALADALTIARRAGVDGAVLFDSLSRGSADSFALRSHGAKSLLPGVFPEAAFAVNYMQKDLGYALDLAAENGVAARAARIAADLLTAADAAGYGANYYPAVLRVIEDDAG